MAGEGLGLALTRRLIDEALKRYHGLYWSVITREHKDAQFTQDLGLPERLRYEDGIEYVEIELSSQRSE